MNSGSHPHMRYIPQAATATSSPGIYDRVAKRLFPRDYSAVETLDTCAWLNSRHTGHEPTLGAHKRTVGMRPELASDFEVRPIA